TLRRCNSRINDVAMQALFFPVSGEYFCPEAIYVVGPRDRHHVFDRLEFRALSLCSLPSA
ncbi:MAG: hypothetical protein OEM03_10980, partial [Chromatiales bacterium]|nr:hypothetical protein [Chromatiales bacterium]